ncbi:MAG: HAD family hydrolase, partial [Candidatus Dormibacteria bacterium]
VRAGLVATQRAWAEGGVHPDPEAVEVLEELSRQGLRLGLCSNALYPPDLMREQLVRLGLARFFDATLFTSEIGWRKPSERVFRELLVRLELPAREVWFVGDDWEADILGARRAGLTPILAPGGSSRDAATTVLAEWAELPRLLT